MTLQEDKIKFKDSKAFVKIIFITFIFILILGFFLGNIKGTMSISPSRILEVILEDDSSIERKVIWNIRLPRVLLSILVGANLSVSGAILQGIMKNPLADPSIIGISSGAGLFGIATLILFPEKQALVPLFAFVGAMLAAGIIYLLAWREGIDTKRIILAGVAVSSLFGAGISALLVFYSDRVHGALTFMNGSMSARSWPEVYTILPYTIICFILAYMFSDKLNILVIGDDVARSLGINVELLRFFYTAIASLLAASAVSVAGLLGFVGLIVPHTARLILGNDYKVLLGSSFLLGGGVLCLSDTFARTIMSPFEIPVGIIMAAIGAPFFLVLLRR